LISIGVGAANDAGRTLTRAALAVTAHLATGTMGRFAAAATIRLLGVRVADR